MHSPEEDGNFVGRRDHVRRYAVMMPLWYDTIRRRANDLLLLPIRWCLSEVVVLATVVLAIANFAMLRWDSAGEMAANSETLG
jgi:hypothetical protein